MNEKGGALPGEGGAESTPALGKPIPSLNAFASIQRMLVAIDFSAIRAAQRAIESAGTFKKIAEAQDAIAKDFARSLDFSRIAATYRTLANRAVTAQAMAVQKQWADVLATSIDFAALNRAVASSVALDSWARTGSAFSKSLRKQTELFARISRDITFELPTIDTSKLVVALHRWIPANLQAIVSLDAVAAIALDEGLPLSWVPRAEIVVLLIEAGDADARVGILTEHRDDILDDCEKALGPIENEWALECVSAVAAIRAGLDGPAQSHASNIILCELLAVISPPVKQVIKCC